MAGQAALWIVESEILQMALHVPPWIVEPEIVKVAGLTLPRLSRLSLLRVVGLACPRIAGLAIPRTVGQDALQAGPNLAIQSSCSAFSLVYGHEGPEDLPFSYQDTLTPSPQPASENKLQFLWQSSEL